MVFNVFNKGIVNKVSLGDLSSGRAFDNGCTCFDSCQGVVNDLRGQKTDCVCSVSSYSKRIRYISIMLLGYTATFLFYSIGTSARTRAGVHSGTYNHWKVAWNDSYKRG